MPGISLSNMRDTLSQQVALSRSQPAAKPLSAAGMLRPSLSTTPAPQQPDAGTAAAVAQVQAFHKTADQADAASASLGNIGATIKSMVELVSLAASSSSAGDRNGINEQLTQLKKELSERVKSPTADGDNWLYQPAGTSSNGQATTQAMTLVSDANAENGVLTKSYAVTTASGSAYSYHLLPSAGSSSSSEISISATTSNEELEGMKKALLSMLEGVGTVGTNLGKVSNDARQSAAGALQDFSQRTALPITDAGQADRQSLAEMAARARDQLAASRLPIANVNLGVLALLR